MLLPACCRKKYVAVTLGSRVILTYILVVLHLFIVTIKPPALRLFSENPYLKDGVYKMKLNIEY